MAKNPGNRSKSTHKDGPMNGAMKLFLAGCAAELYLLVIRRFYIFGNIDQVLAWDEILRYVLYLGGAVLAVGVVLTVMWFKKPGQRRQTALGLTAAGAFLALTAFLIRRYMGSAVTFFSVLVPVLILLGVLWTLYDRECAWSLTVLGAGVMVIWLCWQGVGKIYWNTPVKAVAGLFILALLALALLIRKAAGSGGLLGRVRLLPSSADPAPIYISCAISAAAVVVSIFSSALAYYAMWAMAVVIFALAVYYTVKQL